MIVAARPAPTRARKWLTAILLWVGASVLMAVCDVVASGWVVPLAAAGAVAYSFYAPSWSAFGLGASGLRKTFGVIAGLAALAMLGNVAGYARTEEARRLAELRRTRPAEALAALAKADEPLLAEVGKLSPALESQERARRVQAQAAEEKAVIEQGLLTAAATEKQTRSDAAEEAERDKRANPERHVRLEPYDWYKDGFGNVMMLNATIRNDSAVDLKDFTVRCEHSAPSGTVMDSNTRVIYERVPAGGRKRVRKFSMGFIDQQAATSSCEVTDAAHA